MKSYILYRLDKIDKTLEEIMSKVTELNEKVTALTTVVQEVFTTLDDEITQINQVLEDLKNQNDAALQPAIDALDGILTEHQSLRDKITNIIPDAGPEETDTEEPTEPEN